VRVGGPSLSLRYARPDDADALFEMGRDPQVTQFFSWGPYSVREEAERFIETMERQRESGERLEFVIAGGDDRPLGITGLSDFSLRDRRAIVGTWLGREHWGSGANRESKALICSVAFRSLGLLRVSAVASPGNARSLAALARLGFVEEGVLVGWHVHHGDQRDVTMLRLLREDWERGPLAGVPVSLEGEVPPAFVAG
jgi:RimJ/RimL family protein N-acetyltransferase